MVIPKEYQKMERGLFQTMSLVFVLAFTFLLWGFLLFYAIGDKGPPSWDFGIVQDIPGESAYSTHQPTSRMISEPEPQHISKKPRSVAGEEKGPGGK